MHRSVVRENRVVVGEAGSQTPTRAGTRPLNWQNRLRYAPFRYAPLRSATPVLPVQEPCSRTRGRLGTYTSLIPLTIDKDIYFQGSL